MATASISSHFQLPPCSSVSPALEKRRRRAVKFSRMQCCGISVAHASSAHPWWFAVENSPQSYARNRGVGLLGRDRSARAPRRPAAIQSVGDTRSKAGAVYENRDLFGERRGILRAPRLFRRDRRRPEMIMENRAAAETTMCGGVTEETSSPRRIGATDLLIVGTGVLGTLVGKQWLKEFEGGAVLGETNTDTHHEEIKAAGILPVVKGSNTEKFPHVIFCAPPSGSVDYPGEVRKAAERWSGEGCLLFTSSIGVYDAGDNAEYDESIAPVFDLGRSPRTDALLNAEAETLKLGGNVVRLAGLYTIDRGAHTFYLKKKSVEARPDHFLNLIHYEDAASLCVAILRNKSRGEIYLGCDSTALTRKELMDALNESGHFEEKFEGFTGVDGPLGKRLTNQKTRETTGWGPKYESFRKFLGV